MRLTKLFVIAGLLAVSALYAEDKLIRVAESEAKKAIVSKSDPQYPAIARQMHLTGRAVVDIYIDEEGNVEKAEPVSGNQLLTGSAISCVKRWKFSSFGGKKAVTTFAFDFKL